MVRRSLAIDSQPCRVVLYRSHVESFQRHVFCLTRQWAGDRLGTADRSTKDSGAECVSPLQLGVMRDRWAGYFRHGCSYLTRPNIHDGGPARTSATSILTVEGPMTDLELSRLGPGNTGPSQWIASQRPSALPVVALTTSSCTAPGRPRCQAPRRRTPSRTGMPRPTHITKMS